MTTPNASFKALQRKQGEAFATYNRRVHEERARLVLAGAHLKSEKLQREARLKRHEELSRLLEESKREKKKLQRRAAMMGLQDANTTTPLGGEKRRQTAEERAAMMEQRHREALRTKEARLQKAIAAEMQKEEVKRKEKARLVEQLTTKVMYEWRAAGATSPVKDGIVPVNYPYLGVLPSNHGRMAAGFLDDERSYALMFGPPKIFLAPKLETSDPVLKQKHEQLVASKTGYDPRILHYLPRHGTTSTSYPRSRRDSFSSQQRRSSAPYYSSTNRQRFGSPDRRGSANVEETSSSPSEGAGSSSTNPSTNNN